MHLSPADLHILLVEPSDVQRKIIRKKLAEENVNQVVEAASMQQAMQHIAQHKPDAIACALHFADGTGEQLLKQLKADAATADIPFMLVSSESRKAQLEAFKQSGVVAILPKPFDAMQLGKALNAAVDLLSPAELELTLFDVHDVRVLVVDDSRLARNHIKRVLQNLGIQHLTEAEDGQQAIELLKNNNISFKQIKNDTIIEVESYRIADFKTVPSAYEGHYLHSKVETVVEEQTVSLKPGDLIIPTNQRYSRFIHSVLQPKTEDSYFAWNFFDSYVQQKEYFSAYVFEDRAAEILRGDPALKLAFEEKKRLDDKFRDSSWEQLYYIYRNSSNFEPSWHRLPVYQLY